MPAFGLLGIDFGHGFDAFQGKLPNGWETHFIIGHNLKKLNQRFSNTIKL
jgi:hypothetical protein